MNVDKGKQLAAAWLKGSPASPELMLGEERLAYEYLELLAVHQSMTDELLRLADCLIDAQNELHGIKYTRPAKKTIRYVEDKLRGLAR